MLETIKVTQKGHTLLMLRKNELFDKLKSVQEKKGEAADVGGNQWHDNSSFEDLCRQEMMLNKSISDISSKISMTELIGFPCNDEFLQIGHIATLELDDGEEREYEIAGFGESDLKVVPQKIEYLAPIVRELIGNKIGRSAKVSIGRKIREVTLIKIAQKEI